MAKIHEAASVIVLQVRRARAQTPRMTAAQRRDASGVEAEAERLDI
ncbi:hypothetical protein [Burkholderia ambifaria]|nr:hypothetical protein [Burkholderia ambifaria]